MVTMLDNRWLTIEEAVEVIGCTPGYVRILLRDEKLIGKKLGDRLWLVDVDSAKEFAKKPASTGRPRNALMKVSQKNQKVSLTVLSRSVKLSHTAARTGTRATV